MLKSQVHNSTYYCVATTTLLLLLSLFLLHTRLSSPPSHGLHHHRATRGDGDFDAALIRDPINEPDDSRLLSEDAILTRIIDSTEVEETDQSQSSSGYYFDHASLVFRRVVDSRSVDDVQRWTDYATPFLDLHDHNTEVAFGSDDMPLDEELRLKLIKVNGIEDALLLKLGSSFSPLREGWGAWFDAKSDFLRKDRMFKSKLELLNPLNNPFLQDPDGSGVTGLTRGDKVLQKWLIHAVKKSPSIVRKSAGYSDIKYSEAHIDHTAKQLNNKDGRSLDRGNAGQGHVDQEIEVRQSDDRALDDNKFNALGGSAIKGVNDRSLRKSTEDLGASLGKISEGETLNVANSIEHSKPELSGFMHAGGRKWGYFPGLHPHLSFSNFMDSFFRKSKCSMRVFMVWNSPPWMYTVRHQRGLESLLFHHSDACVVVFSETIELDFFKEFHKDGFKIAVAMPNLEELLKDTPTSIFASVWHEWRITRYYSTHYSELIRLAALYKYGGIYLDCDIVVLKPISAFGNSVGMEYFADGNLLNGAVMAFNKSSFFILQCLSEFVSTYDDTLVRWNGADLLTRVAGNYSNKANGADKEQLLKVQSTSIFFPISSYDIHRYFRAPETSSEEAHQNTILKKILDESYTFHFWNSLTSALVPEPGSLVARIMGNFCIRCLDVL